MLITDRSQQTRYLRGVIITAEEAIKKSRGNRRGALRLMDKWNIPQADANCVLDHIYRDKIEATLAIHDWSRESAFRALCISMPGFDRLTYDRIAHDLVTRDVRYVNRYIRKRGYAHTRYYLREQGWPDKRIELAFAIALERGIDRRGTN